MFASTQRGLGWKWMRRRQTEAGPRITIDWGRDASVNTELAGTSDVKRSLEAGGYFVHYTGPWRINGDVRTGITAGHKGLHANVGAALGGRLSERNTLILGGSLHYTSNKYNQAYYGVAGSGFTGLGLHGDILRTVRAGGYVGFSVRVDQLLGAAKDATFTRSRQYFAGGVVGVRF